VLVLILGGVGLLLLAAELWAVVARRRRRKAGWRPPRHLGWVSIVTGLALAAAFTFSSYRLTPAVRIFGAPFISAAWKLEGGEWQEYVSVLTGPAMAANVAVGMLLPLLVHEVVLRLRKRPR
jgi:hypothetical protein